jgi:hypothetical protein
MPVVCNPVILFRRTTIRERIPLRWLLMLLWLLWLLLMLLLLLVGLLLLLRLIVRRIWYWPARNLELGIHALWLRSHCRATLIIVSSKIRMQTSIPMLGYRIPLHSHGRFYWALEVPRMAMGIDLHGTWNTLCWLRRVLLCLQEI